MNIGERLEYFIQNTPNNLSTNTPTLLVDIPSSQCNSPSPQLDKLDKFIFDNVSSVDSDDFNQDDPTLNIVLFKQKSPKSSQKGGGWKSPKYTLPAELGISRNPQGGGYFSSTTSHEKTSSLSNSSVKTFLPSEP